MPECRQSNGAVPMRGHRIGFVRRDVAYEVAVDFYSDIPMDEFLFWTNVADRVRVKIGAGSYVAVGADRSTAVDLGAFTAGETKAGTLEVMVPSSSDDRHIELELDCGVGT